MGLSGYGQDSYFLTIVRSAKAVLRPAEFVQHRELASLAREETMVLGLPRGPRTGMRMSPETVSDVIEPEGISNAADHRLSSVSIWDRILGTHSTRMIC
ncbi:MULTISPECIES: hypothetical protein [unclassified Rhizobium]|uniref:hypothetical protein n=1 Tax=unclassified Rhizobium TaxID=2613769 RepID=UPI003813596E